MKPIRTGQAVPGWTALCGAATLVGAITLAGGCSSGSSGATKPGVSGSFAFWPAAPAEPRIQLIRSIRSSQDVRDEKSSGFQRLVFGEEAEYEAVIEKPYGVEIHDGRIYVCDIRKPALTVLDMAERQVRLIGTSGTNRLTHPVDVAIADDGWIYVADNERNAIIVYDPNERYARTYGHENMNPVGIAVHGDRLYVCDLVAQGIEIFDRNTGQTIGKFGEMGDADGQFRVPIGVDTDTQGNVYVSDMMRARVQKFTADGEFIEGLGELGDYAGSFARPKQLAVDDDGILYVVDAAFQNVQMFSDEQALLMSFGAAGDFPGSMNLPAGICVSNDRLDLFEDEIHPGFEAYRLVAVTNQFGRNKVSLYALGKLRDGWTVADISAAAVQVSAGVGVNPDGAELQAQGEQELEQRPVPSPGDARPPAELEEEDAARGDGG